MTKLTILLSLLGILSSSIFIVDNLMHSVLLLILTFISSSFILFLMKIDFLGFAFIIIYVGAIAILFLFVIMMINIKGAENASTRSIQFFVAVCSCSGLFFNQLFFFVHDQDFLLWGLNIYRIFDHSSNLFLVSSLLYSFYNFSFLIAGLVLLVAMLGAVLLTLNFSSYNVSQVVPKQNARVSYYLFCGLVPKKESFYGLRVDYLGCDFPAETHLYDTIKALEGYKIVAILGVSKNFYTQKLSNKSLFLFIIIQGSPHDFNKNFILNIKLFKPEVMVCSKVESYLSDLLSSHLTDLDKVWACPATKLFVRDKKISISGKHSSYFYSKD